MAASRSSTARRLLALVWMAGAVIAGSGCRTTAQPAFVGTVALESVATANPHSAHRVRFASVGEPVGDTTLYGYALTVASLDQHPGDAFSILLLRSATPASDDSTWQAWRLDVPSPPADWSPAAEIERWRRLAACAADSRTDAPDVHRLHGEVRMVADGTTPEQCIIAVDLRGRDGEALAGVFRVHRSSTLHPVLMVPFVPVLAISGLASGTFP